MMACLLTEIRTNQAKVDVNLKEMKAGHEEITEIRQFKEELNPLTEVNLGKMEARIETSHEPREAKIKSGLEEVKATNLEANPEKVQTVAEHQYVPND
jgi:hypothetical protein